MPKLSSPALSRLIKRTRTLSKLSQEAFAKQLGANKSTVSRWEAGENIPGDSKIVESHLKAILIDISSRGNPQARALLEQLHKLEKKVVQVSPECVACTHVSELLDGKTTAEQQLAVKVTQVRKLQEQVNDQLVKIGNLEQYQLFALQEMARLRQAEEFFKLESARLRQTESLALAEVARLQQNEEPLQAEIVRLREVNEQFQEEIQQLQENAAQLQFELEQSQRLLQDTQQQAELTQQQLEQHDHTQAYLEVLISDYSQAEAISRTGHWEFDVETKSATWSHQMFAIFGLPVTAPAPPDYLIAELFEADSVVALQTAFQEAIVNGTPYNIELWGRRGGERRYLIAKGYAEYEDGAVCRVFGTIQDLTDIRNKIQEQLQQTFSRVEHFSQLKESSLQTLSSELRSPITRMKLAIQMLRNLITNPADAGGNRTFEYLDILEQECTRENELIQNLFLKNEQI